MHDPDNRFFDYMEANQYHGKNGGLEHDWLDERPIFYIVSDMKKLCDQHDLCQGQCIDKSKPLMVNQALFIQNERFMKGKQTQQNPKIDKYPE
jgi:hypothetical protein